MQMKKYLSLFVLLVFISCSEEEVGDISLSLLSTQVNGAALTDGTANVDTSASFVLVFSEALDPSSFEMAFSLTGNGQEVSNLQFDYTNVSTRVVIEAHLAPDANYQLQVSTNPIGQNQEALSEALLLNFTTVAGEGVITERPPCLSANQDCVETLAISNGSGSTGSLDIYSSFPLNLENARWEKLENAVIAIHGVNRDADNYFSYLVNSLTSENLTENTLLIAPFFKDDTDAQGDDLFWASSSSWREGQVSGDANQVSSFAAIDQIIEVLADSTRFPVLKNILITGHSSGGLFTHVYAIANQSESLYPDLDFQYVVANSQYFYYPEDVRYNPSNQQFEDVNNCNAFNQWPLGAVGLPAYLTGATEATLRQQMTEREITYLLGTDDVVTTGTLNTSDCEAVLLGENRFRRGENIFLLMETFYTDTHVHEKVLVEGVGHNAQEMYQSSAFRAWLGAAF